MAITSDEVNYLIYRYLLESGFSHSAFTFGIESHIHDSSIDSSQVPPGALVTVIQKGVQYVEAETSIAEDGTIVEDSKLAQLSLLGAVVQSSLIAKKHSRAKMEKLKVEEDSVSGVDEEEAMDTLKSTVAHQTTVLSQDLVIQLAGHTSEVLTCQWHPQEDLLASGSADSTARLWSLDTPGATPHVLQHDSNSSGSKARDGCDVTTLHWKHDGSLLATGCYDGQARIWMKDGSSQTTLNQHQGPVFAIKWNPKGTFLATGSVDMSTLIWDPQTSEVKQKLEMHKAAVLDLDWQSNNTVATCSSDNLVYVWKIGTDKPIKTFTGHKNGVNCIHWDPSGTLLASCSDDRTAKIWSMKQESCLHDLVDHIGDVYTLKWSPTGPGSANPNLPLVLATASFDSTVRLWDPESGRCLHTLEHHTQPVYSVAFSPDGRYLATGSRDKLCLIWNVKDGRLVRQYEGGGGIFEIAWNYTGLKLAASFQDSTISVLDLRKLGVTQD